MPATATTEITLEMLIEEHQRIRGYMTACYPQMVKDHKISPYERDFRLNCNQATINLLNTLAEQDHSTGSVISKILNQ
jgi:hypothetical protein